MPLAPEIIVAPLAARGPRLSAAIDRHLANCAGTIGVPGAELAMRGRLVRDQADIASEWGHRIASTRLTLSIDPSLLVSSAPDLPARDYLTDSNGVTLTDSAGNKLWIADGTVVTMAHGEVSPTVVSITSGLGIGRYVIAEVIATDAGRLLLVLQAAPA